MVKNQSAANRLHKIIGHREFTARMAVDILAAEGYRFTPHANAMAILLKRDNRFIMTKRTDQGIHYKKCV